MEVEGDGGDGLVEGVLCSACEPVQGAPGRGDPGDEWCIQADDPQDEARVGGVTHPRVHTYKIAKFIYYFP